MAYLYAHPNPNAPVRSNGIRFWGYPQRSSPVRVIVIHTAENTPDTVAADGGAEAVARYQSTVERPSSYHEIGDSDSHVVQLPPDAVAFGAKGANADGWHYSFATKAALWSQMPDRWVDGALDIGARRVALAAALHDVPLARLSRAQITDGRSKGLASHADTEAVFGTPGRRSDPGASFPWLRFLDLARYHQEDDVALTPEQEADLEFAGKVRRVLENVGSNPMAFKYLVEHLRDHRKAPVGEHSHTAGDHSHEEYATKNHRHDTRYAVRGHGHTVQLVD